MKNEKFFGNLSESFNSLQAALGLVLVLTWAPASAFCAPGAAAPAAAAQKPSGGVCAEFRTKYCAGMNFPSPELGQCLLAHEASLSPDCRKAVQETAGCSEFGKKFCTDTPKISREHVACMLSHKDQLSETCIAILNKSKVLWDSCKAPIKKLCDGLPTPVSAYCLWDHKAELPPECSNVLTKPTRPPPQGYLRPIKTPAKAVALPAGLAIPNAPPVAPNAEAPPQK
jgi:hypothetical protein